jgi:hypothetical protein
MGQPRRQGTTDLADGIRGQSAGTFQSPRLTGGTPLGLADTSQVDPRTVGPQLQPLPPASFPARPNVSDVVGGVGDAQRMLGQAFTGSSGVPTIEQIMQQVARNLQMNSQALGQSRPLRFGASELR